MSHYFSKSSFSDGRFPKNMSIVIVLNFSIVGRVNTKNFSTSSKPSFLFLKPIQQSWLSAQRPKRIIRSCA